ncbi:uncharacterized protein DS421_8g244000 [Arachis hypogaea]|nr:uncharacterized protein DS421_8g244000 [Arachis hypogaea]
MLSHESASILKNLRLLRRPLLIRIGQRPLMMSWLLWREITLGHSTCCLLGFHPVMYSLAMIIASSPKHLLLVLLLFAILDYVDDLILVGSLGLICLKSPLTAP